MKKPVRILISVIFWIGLWQIISSVIGEELLFPSPISTLKALLKLMQNADFYKNIGQTFLRIAAGVSFAAVLGTALGILAGLFSPVDDLLQPAMTVIRATPVASFIVLLVLWLARSTVPMIISGIIVLPVFYSNVKVGIRQADPELLEMARVYRLSFGTRLVKILLPGLKPGLQSAAGASFGMAWKAGVAAEVIVLPVISIGRRLYYASNSLETAEMFAWTTAVILLSLLMDLLVSFLFGRKKGGRKNDSI